MEKTLLSRLPGSDIKPYVMSTRGSNVSGSSFVLPPRAFIVLDFSKSNAEFCVINFRRDSGNGFTFTHCDGHNVEQKITSKTNQSLEFRLRGDKKVHVHRANRGSGSVSITSIEFYKNMETPVDWNSKLKQCRKHACIRLVGNTLYASEGGFIDGDIVKIETDPPGAFVHDGNLIKFVTSCKIEILEIAGTSLHSAKIPNLSPQKLRHIDITPQNKTPVPGKDWSPSQVFVNEYTPVDPGWHLNVPKVIHFYWGGKLTFLRYASIYSCAKHNPDWKIKLHVPEILGATKPTWRSSEQAGLTKIQESTNDYMSFVEKIDGLEIIKHDFEKYNFKNSAHEVHKSDLLRWILLSSEGGLWSDCDILYHQPMCVMIDNKPDNSKYTAGICRYDTSSHAIGFLMASQDNPFYKNVLQLARKSFRPNLYQSIGAIIFNKKIKSIGPDVLYLNPQSVYSITDEGIPKFLSEKTYIQNYREAIGFHWYGGHPNISKIESSTDHTNYQTNNTFLGKLVRLAMS